MKCVIAGSRTLGSYKDGYKRVQKSLEECPFIEEGFELCDWKNRITEIVSGEAFGIDRLGEQLADKKGLEKALFPAKWDEYGRKAGHMRNYDMAKYADMAIIYWDGRSKGTENMIRQMEKFKKPYILYTVTGGQICRVK